MYSVYIFLNIMKRTWFHAVNESSRDITRDIWDLCVILHLTLILVAFWEAEDYWNRAAFEACSELQFHVIYSFPCTFIDVLKCSRHAENLLWNITYEQYTRDLVAESILTAETWHHFRAFIRMSRKANLLSAILCESVHGVGLTEPPLQHEVSW